MPEKVSLEEKFGSFDDLWRSEATSVLLDQRLFLLDDKAYARFLAALDQPPTENRRLRRLLTTKAPWEK